MADSILGLVAEAASSTLFIFCVFNFIIFLILFTSSSSSSSFHHHQQQQHSDEPLSIVIHTNTNAQQSTNQNSTVGVCEQVTETQNEPDGCINFNCSDNATDHNSDDADDDDDDDDLRRRVEEFIEMVNRGWKEERQSISTSA